MITGKTGRNKPDAMHIGLFCFMQTTQRRKPVQDKFTATLWLNEAIKKAESKQQGGTVAYVIFSERMIAQKYRIESWHLEYIGEKFKFKPAWAVFKYGALLPQHK